MNILINLICICTLLILLFWVNHDIVFQNREIKVLSITYVLMIIVILSEIGYTVSDMNGDSFYIFNWVSNIVFFSVTPFVAIWNSAVYQKEQYKYKYFYYFFPLVNMGLVCLTPVTKWMFTIEPGNVYVRGALFPLYAIILSCSLLLSCILVFRRTRDYPMYFRRLVIVSYLFFCIGTSMQFCLPQYHTAWLCITLFSLLQCFFLAEKHALMDGLTEALNRAAFDNKMADLFRNHSEYGVLIMADVNEFKNVNDQYGHLYGDYCLKEMTRILKRVFSKNAEIFRYGGDEFSIVTENISLQEVEELCQKVHACVEEKRQKDSHFPTIAFGYSEYKTDSSIQDAIAVSDKNLYMNKQEKKKI